MQSEHTVDGRNRVLPAIHDNPMRSEIRDTRTVSLDLYMRIA